MSFIIMDPGYDVEMLLYFFGVLYNIWQIPTEEDSNKIADQNSSKLSRSLKKKNLKKCDS